MAVKKKKNSSEFNSVFYFSLQKFSSYLWCNIMLYQCREKTEFFGQAHKFFYTGLMIENIK